MAKNGVSQKVYIVETSGSTTSYTAIKGEKTNTINVNANAIDTSDKDNAWDACIAGSKSWDLSVECNLDNTASAKQKDFMTGLIAGTEVGVFVGELDSSTPSEGYAGSGIVTSVSEVRTRGEVISRTINIKGNGALTPTWPA